MGRAALAHSAKSQITENEYLDAEQDAEVRHELIDCYAGVLDNKTIAEKPSRRAFLRKT
ncbi:MAG: hypothetical protein RQ733_04540 [Methyloprofundus sp.]|nr:hypothetical protein [Methyloprofundus sp.]MDT8425222.1 hypothetical protein [Methyloprofundus sp.]